MDRMAATGEFKSCPFCKEQIRTAAVKCRFCGEWLERPAQQAPGLCPPERPVAVGEPPSPQSPTSAPGTGEVVSGALEPSETKPSKEGNGMDSMRTWLQQHDSGVGSSNAAGERNQKQQESSASIQLESNKEVTNLPTDLSTTASPQKPSTPVPSLAQVEPTESQPHAPQRGLGPLLPLFFICFCILGYVAPMAIRNGASGAIGIALGTLSYCTTPGSIVVLPILAIWFWTAHRKRSLAYTVGEVVRRPGSPLLLTIAATLALIGGSYANIKAAFEARNVAQRQKLSGLGVKLDRFKDWEVAKGADQSAVDARLGFPAAQKKRMREAFALNLIGVLASVPNANVELQGPEHDKLLLSSPALDATTASNMPPLLRTADADFWNRVRFLGFSEFIFSGSNYYYSIPATEFALWGNGYETFVSNMVAMYDTNGNGELNAATQKILRQNFASVFKGTFSAIYKALDVRLEGEDEDILIFYIKEMDAAAANELLKVLKDNKGRNFGNALRAMAFRELALRGDNYNISYSRSNFIDWSYNYEKYLSEVRKAAERISGAVKSE
jgi:hypothetical protein